jgi:hypothetical protein
MQSYHDKFDLPKKNYRMPAPAESVLVAGKKKTLKKVSLKSKKRRQDNSNSDSK